VDARAPSEQVGQRIHGSIVSSSTSDYGLDFRCRSRGRLILGRALERVFDPAWLLGESGEDEMLSEQAAALGIA
jgi:hypothetical protein